MTRIPTPGGSPSDIPSFGVTSGPAGKSTQARTVAGATPAIVPQPDAIAYVDGFGVLPAGPPSLPHVAGALDAAGLGSGSAPVADVDVDVDVAIGFGLPAPRPEAGVAPFDPLRVTGVLSPAAFGGHPGYPGSPEPVFAGAGAVDALAAPPGGPVVSYTLRVNGAMHVVDGAWIGESLLAVLRERLGLPGAKDGCGQGVCGTCTVLVDGAPSAACMIPAATVGDRAVVTVEGLTDQGACAAIQRALIAHGAVQCGFCVPGVVVSAHALLARIPKPDEATVRRALAGHPCRCVGPNRMVAAVCAAAAGEQDEPPPASVFEPAQTSEPGASGARA